MTEYPSAEEVFGPGRVVRIDRYDALRDDRSDCSRCGADLRHVSARVPAATPEDET